MFNIFLDPRYTLRKKNYFEFPIRNSQFSNRLIQFYFFLKLSIPKNLISSGTLMLMNNLIKNFRKINNISINKLIYSNSYIVQFDKFGEKTLKNIINSKNKNTKVLVGPLYTIDQLKKLILYVDKYPFIKILVSNMQSLESIRDTFNLQILDKNIIPMPCGVLSESEIYFGGQSNRNDECLIYFKNKDFKKLDTIIKFLESQNIKFKIFENNFYKNKDLIKAAKICKFAIVLTTTESQGFGVQELMSQNIPLLVLDQNTTIYENKKIIGTSVPYWSNNCGIVVSNLNELKNNFNIFYSNLDNFNSANYFKEVLTYEKHTINLENTFQRFN